ncbi:MAG: hypothetical protein WC801_00565 [Patescibacteria group bacterium]|jgi:hypothetical protein
MKKSISLIVACAIVGVIMMAVQFSVFAQNSAPVAAQPLPTLPTGYGYSMPGGVRALPSGDLTVLEMQGACLRSEEEANKALQAALMRGGEVVGLGMTSSAKCLEATASLLAAQRAADVAGSGNASGGTFKYYNHSADGSSTGISMPAFTFAETPVRNDDVPDLGADLPADEPPRRNRSWVRPAIITTGVVIATGLLTYGLTHMKQPLVTANGGDVNTGGQAAMMTTPSFPGTNR